VTARPTVVCLTPVRDEAWILGRFLACASVWADVIVVADQCSTDGSREIAAAHPKVRLIDNGVEQFNEPVRQASLIAAARAAVPGARLLVALDADEVLSANALESAEWQSVLAAPPGMVIEFERVNLHADGSRCWIPRWDFPFGYVDDGAPHVGLPIHSPRVPVPADAPRLRLREVKVLHYAHMDRERLRSRDRWYQCWEALNRPPIPGSEQYRQYHQFGQAETLRPVPPEWLDGYRRAGIDVTSVIVEGRYRWDRLVLEMLREHGAAPFRRVDMWDVDWHALAARWNVPAHVLPPDPRSWLDRQVLRYLKRTQGRQDRFLWHRVDRWLRFVGW
jgi:hypothetical protein